MTQTTHPERDEELESLVRWIVDIAQAYAEDKPVATFPVAEVRKRIAAHTAKAVEEAREQAWLAGYEAGQAVASGKLKGITWEEAKKRIATPREERKP